MMGSSKKSNLLYGRIDLNEHLIKDITSAYVVRVSGESMEGGGISDGDELIVNRALEPRDGSMVAAVLDGELTIKRRRVTPAGVVLQAENPVYPDLHVPALSDLVIWASQPAASTTSNRAAGFDGEDEGVEADSDAAYAADRTVDVNCLTSLHTLKLTTKIAHHSASWWNDRPISRQSEENGEAVSYLRRRRRDLPTQFGSERFPRDSYDQPITT